MPEIVKAKVGKTTLEGSPSALAKILKAMNLDDSDGEPPQEPSPPKRTKKDEKIGPGRRRCRAIKASGERCRHSDASARIDAQQLCWSHRHWLTLGHAVAPLGT